MVNDTRNRCHRTALPWPKTWARRLEHNPAEWLMVRQDCAEAGAMLLPAEIACHAQAIKGARYG